MHNEPTRVPDAEFDPNAGYEERDLMGKKTMFRAMAGLFAFVVVVMLIAWIAERSWTNEAKAANGRAAPMAELRPDKPMDTPVVESDPGKDGNEYRAAEKIRVDGYGWIEKDKGTVHMPIDEAMKKAMERGFPSRNEGEATN